MLEVGNFNLGEEDEGAIEKRQIRQNYRSLIDELNRNKEELINPSSDALDEHLSKAEIYSKPIFGSTQIRTREAALDSFTLTLISSLGKQKAQALNTEFLHFQPLEYADKLKTSVGLEHLEPDAERSIIARSGWVKLGLQCCNLFARFPPLHLLHGSFDPDTVQLHKNIRKPRVPELPLGQATIPRQIVKFGADAEEATTEEVENVLKYLRDYYKAEGDNPICYFRFVVNPHSFGQTVENVFHVSFLVRDGLIRFFLDDDKLPVIEPVIRNDFKKKQNTFNTKQCVYFISPGEWREIIKTFEITTAVIPTRTRTSVTADSSVNSPSTSKVRKNSNKSTKGKENTQDSFS